MARPEAGKRGLTVENQRSKAVALDRAAQKFARREDVLLARHFVECARAHPRRQRLGRTRLARLRGGNFKKVGHGGCPSPSTASRPTASQNPEHCPHFAHAGVWLECAPRNALIQFHPQILLKIPKLEPSQQRDHSKQRSFRLRAASCSRRRYPTRSENLCRHVRGRKCFGSNE